MIRQPTVIILGAGASSDYGFPLGRRLLYKIFQQLRPKAKAWIPKLIECGISSEEVEKFREALLLSQASSVDSFIEHRPEFMRVGKLVIALSLILAEDDNQLFIEGGPISGSYGCYQYIFDKMKSGTAQFEEFKQNKLSIITFNYDRSFEHYLFTALKNTYNKSIDECAGILKEVPIIHVYGSLGKLPWQLSDAGEEKRDYTPEIGLKEINIAADQIIIVSEGDDTSEEFKKAIRCLREAKRVYFLGFGYNGTNLNRLQIKRMSPEIRAMRQQPLSEWQMRGSALNLGQSERLQIQSEWKIFLPATDDNCLDFLRNQAILS